MSASLQQLNGTAGRDETNAVRVFPRRKSDKSVTLRRSSADAWIACKPWFDRIVATLLLIPGLPVVGLLCVLVKLTSRGPALYSQRRLGRYGRQFWIYKLRTMQHDCERLTGAVWAQPQDPRVTALGRILRVTHLDELPQLFNVLRGEMSLVGPRPERPEIVDCLVPEIPDYEDRLGVLPGLTGLAQICVHADSTLDDVRTKLKYDLAYMRQASFSLDVRILICTAFKVFGLNRSWLRAIVLAGVDLPRKWRVTSPRPIAAQSPPPRRSLAQGVPGVCAEPPPPVLV